MERQEKDILLQKLAEASQKLQVAYNHIDEAEAKLKEYEEKAQQAEKASRMKSLFLANMSHEIRTPLNAIEGFSRIMCETDSQSERMKYMEIIESNNARLLSLIDEIEAFLYLIECTDEVVNLIILHVNNILERVLLCLSLSSAIRSNIPPTEASATVTDSSTTDRT